MNAIFPSESMPIRTSVKVSEVSEYISACLSKLKIDYWDMIPVHNGKSINAT